MKRIVGLIVVNLTVILILGIWTPHFLTGSNIAVILNNMALETVVLGGYTLLLIAGYFDLSTDGVISFSGVATGLLILSGTPWVLASLAGLFLGGLVGFINGYVVTRLKINGFITTLTTWWICTGFSLGLTKAIAPYGFPAAFQAIGQAKFFGLRIISFYAVVVIVITSIVLNYTKFGAHIYIVGDNKLSADLMKIPVAEVGTKLYIFVGLLAGSVGLLTAAKLNAASPVVVDGLALRVIAAAVIGGANLSGGKGSIIGGWLGLLLMNLLNNAVILIGMSPYWQKAILGGILFSAILFDQFRSRR